MIKRTHLMPLLICALLLFHLFAFAQDLPSDEVKGGVDAVTIGRLSRTSGGKPLMGKDAGVLSLSHFYRIGGQNVPATPTDCRLAYSDDSLFLLFRCTEPDMSYLTKDHHENWYRLCRSPVEQDAAFPDKVDFFIRSSLADSAYYHFSVTKAGEGFGVKYDPLSSTGRYGHFQVLSSFRYDVMEENHEWRVSLRIPWKLVGGRPRSYFGVLPLRTRWRNGEVISPVALDFTDRPPADLYIEACLGARPVIFLGKKQLCRLPSGALRWQRSACLSYPPFKVIKQIRALQTSLHQATTIDNLGNRVYLTQRWIDLLALEGFNFGSTTGSITPEDMFPEVIRENVNQALLEKDTKKACTLLDAYIGRLARMSAQWFADGSPGDMVAAGWTPLKAILSVREADSVLTIHCLAGRRPVDLHLALPASGGVRLWMDKGGFFKPARLLPLKVTEKVPGAYSVRYGSGTITVCKNPFRISFYDDTGRLKLCIRSSDIAFKLDSSENITGTDFRNRLHPHEMIYGFGERYDQFNQRGNILTLWGMDDWTGNTVGLHNETYKPIPVFHSSEGYMVFINSSYRLRADIGKTQPGQYRLTQQGDVFDYYFWFSSPRSALISYSNLTGKPLLPPRWAFEPWIGRTGRAWAGTSLHDPVAEQERVITRFRQLDIPFSAIYAEGSGADNPSLYTFLAPRHIRALSWYFSSVSGKVQKALMPGITAAELPVLRFRDTVHSNLHEINYVDFTNPNAEEMARMWWKRRLDLGVAGSMVDFGDRVPEDALFYNGKLGDEMHNFYAYYYHKTYSDIFRERRGNDYILFARSAAPGDQRWICQFAGDHAANYRGLRGVLNGILNLSACGFSTWGSDLGGFRGWPDPEVYMRWTQFACFSPLMRCHGRTSRDPWEYGRTALENFKYYAWVRENLLDYVYNEAVNAHKTGVPMVRSLAVEYPLDSKQSAANDEYFFGRDLLVAPVTNEDTFRTVFFPSGRWTDLWSGKVMTGIKNSRVTVPLKSIPVYLRNGAIVPIALNQSSEFGKSMKDDKVNALIVTPPLGQRERQLADSEGSPSNVRLSARHAGFDIYLGNCLRMRYLIIAGKSVSGVCVNGERLPMLKENKKDALPPGWYWDESHRRTVIRLISAVNRSIEISY